MEEQMIRVAEERRAEEQMNTETKDVISKGKEEERAQLS